MPLEKKNTFLFNNVIFCSISDYAQQFQNQNSNRGKTRDQDVQVSQREQQKKQQFQQQQSNVFNSAAQDYNEQYNLQVEPGCEERKMRVINVCLWESVNILGDLSQQKKGGIFHVWLKLAFVISLC